jgi:di/tricarboxylate transporter
VSPALLSLFALLVAISLSIATRVNVGLIAIAFAWLIGVYVADLGADAVMRGFPATLFLTLAGVTLLFAAAEDNGTLERLAQRALSFARGDSRVVLVLLFVISGVIASVGPGALVTVALVAPIAMATGERAGLPPFLTALMVANGANAGNLSPISAVGIIVNTRMAEAGLPGHEARVWFANFAVHLVVSAAGYLLLGGYRRFGAATDAEVSPANTPFSMQQRITMAIIAAWIAGVLLFKLNVGLSAFAAIAQLVLFRAAQDRNAFKRVPWGVIVMVCGVSLLISVLEATKGMDLFTSLLARFATPATINGVIAFVTGAISTWSSTSGVVYPAFLPTVPGIVQHLGGGDALAIALSINIGAALVDVSPLSTSGALCLAAAPVDAAGAAKLFRNLMIWGFSMVLVGAVLCQLFAGWLAHI